MLKEDIMKKLENLYVGIEEKRLAGGIDIDWAASQKPRYFQIQCKGETVLFIDLKILLLGHVDDASVNDRYSRQPKVS